MYRESQTLSCRCEAIYDVVADVASYPEFLPGWKEVQTDTRSDGSMHVAQHVSVGPVNERLVSVARFERPRRIVVEPDPNQKTAGIALAWQFSATPSGHCRVDLRIEGRARNPLVRGMLNLMIHRTARDLIQRFARRVNALYGESCEIV